VESPVIDNAGGVNTSDREVSLKILIDTCVDAGALQPGDRDGVLAKCARAVVDDVLADNSRQTAAISVAEAHGPFLLDRHARVMPNIEEVVGLDRAHAQLPTEAEVARRRGQGRGLARPEIAVLLSHAKNVLATEIACTEVPDDAAMEDILFDYFPEPVRTRFADGIRDHPLAREIVCTRLASAVIDRVGPGFVYRLEDRTGADSAQCLRGYLVVRDLLGLEEVWDGLDSLPLEVTAPVRRAIERTVDHNACWLVRRADRLDPDRARKELGPHVQRLREWLENSADPVLSDMVAELISHGAPERVARRAAAAARLFPAFDLANAVVADETGTDVVASRGAHSTSALAWSWTG
jgi:glutamate dehydrogenase